MNLICLLLSVIYFFNIHALLNVSHQNDEVINCMDEVLKKYPGGYNLFVSNVDKTIKFASPMIVYAEEKLVTTDVFKRFQSFVFLLKDLHKLDEKLSYLYKSWYWNSRAKYLIGYYGKIEDIDHIFQIVWKYSIFNIDIIVSNGSKVNIYTFYPYKDDNCAEYKNYELLSTCNELSTNMYPLKIPLDLHGCGVKLMPYVIQPFVTNISAPRDDPALAGVEVTIVNAIARKMNFTEVYIKNPYVHWGYKYKDGSYSLMFKDLYDKKIDLIFGFVYGNSSYTFDFDPSFCHLTDKSVWFFPTALQIAQWKNLTAIFEPILWLIIFVMIFINGVAWWIIGKKREKSDEFNEFSLCQMQSLYVMLQGSVTSPKRANVRLTFSLWSISCLLIFTAHQCQLISILTTPLYEKQMQTLEDLLNSKLEFGFYPTITDAYINTSNWINKQIMAKYQTCPLTAECLNRTAFKRDFAVVKNIRQVGYLMPRIYTFSNGRPMLYETQEVAFQTKPRYHAVKGFPLLERFDYLLMLLASNGLVNKWDIDSRFKVIKVESEPDHEPLSIAHLQGAFYVWLFGVIGAVLILIFEIICYYVIYYYRKHQNKIKELVNP